ncbi:hypothetical protein AB0E01_35280 [Nocardia vinacea]|uniref:hypothetical protein n=1 Tax=Nocardia vinacea TaxID=96468 RepID=UPI003409CC44
MTGYGAAIGRPTLLTTFTDVPPDTPIAELGVTAARLPPHGPFTDLIDSVIAQHDPHRFARVSNQVTSEPGRSLALLRSLFYRILELTEPPVEVPLPVLPAPVITDAPAVHADLVTAEVNGRSIRLTRRPAEVRRALVGVHEPNTRPTYLSCSVDYPMRSLRDTARVLIGGPSDAGGDPRSWLRETLHRHPMCAVAALADQDSCIAMLRSGDVITLDGTDLPAAALPSALFAWLDAGFDITALPGSFVIELGRARASVIVSLS